jgi:hypothetical protein
METTSVLNHRVAARRFPLNRFDPVYQLLDRVVFRDMFRPPKRSIAGAFEPITAADADFLLDNLQKHRLVLWLNLLLAVYLLLVEASSKLGGPAATALAIGLLAPAIVSGAAWYTVTFGGIPEKFLSGSFTLTACLFLAFTLTMTLLMGTLMTLTTWPVAVFILVPIYLALYLAGILHDNLDGLKIGLDTSQLKFSRAALRYYQKHGLVARTEAELELIEDHSPSLTSQEIALFKHYLTMLDNNITQLERERTLEVANHLIASSTGILFGIVNLSLPRRSQIDQGDDFRSYVADAFNSDQAAVDEATVGYLEMAIEALKLSLGPEADSQLELAKADLRSFARLKGQLQSNRNPDEASGHQRMADHLFSQVFRNLLSLLNAHKDILYRGFRTKTVAED